jgi:hypothetical protein
MYAVIFREKLYFETRILLTTCNALCAMYKQFCAYISINISVISGLEWNMKNEFVVLILKHVVLTSCDFITTPVP